MIKSYKEKVEISLNKPDLCLSILDLVLGEKLGSGTTRDVYEFIPDKKYVVKLEKEDAEGDNWAEFRVWHTVKYSEYHRKWFAGCDWISDDGRAMLQKRTKTFYTKGKCKNVPDRIPAYFTDIKESNFGWIGNQLVCHDYSHCIERFGFFALGKRTLDFKKALG